MILNKSGQVMVVSCLKIEITIQAYIMVNWLKRYGKKIFVLSFLLFVLVFVLRVVFFWRNFETYLIYAFNTNIFISN